MKGILKYLLLCGIIFAGLYANGQGVNKLVSAIDSFAVQMPAEKVYLHIDKPYYSNTDTIWLKAYILNRQPENPEQSGVLYTELVNDTGRVVLRQAMPVLMGVSWGQIALDSTEVHEGSYTLRAYTNWMQNIGEAGFFTRQLYISKADEGAWLVNAGYKSSITEGKTSMEVALQLLGQDSDPVRLQDMRLKIMEGGKTRLREKMMTDIDGKLRFNFDVPPKARRLTLVGEAKGSSGSRRIVVPLKPGREANADVQFMPEGGSLVAGLTSKVGFKAIAEDGKGIDIRGIVVDSKKKEVATFKSVHKGIGFFLFTPINNETYTAKVTFPKGLVKYYSLPAIRSSGIVLMVNNIPGRDSIILAIQASADVAGTNSSYSLVAQSGGRVCFASAIKFKDSITSISGRAAKSKFPSGVARFTLFSNTNQPVAERIIFIDHRDRLNISINTDKQSYQPADSVSLGITVTDKDNNPIEGNFSLAVTDDGQIKTDSTNIPDISSYMLLQSELKGTIEEPGYYFGHQTPQTDMQLDNLLLTQGWVAYDWKHVFDKKTKPKFSTEREMRTSGTVKRLNKPQAGLKVTLMSIKSMVFRDTITDAHGRFVFTGLPHTDTPAYVLQVKDKRGKIFEANIYMDEFTPAGTKYLATPDITPWYVNSDSTLLHYNRQYIAFKQQREDLNYAGGLRLKEVVIKAKKVVRRSKNLHGSGNADVVVDEETIIKKKKITLREMIEQGMIKGVRPVYRWMMMYDRGVRLIIDGVNPRYITDGVGILDIITSEDIRGIEMHYNTKYISKYVYEYDPEIAMHVPSMYWPAYMEITTWSGNGPFMKRTHNRALYRPMPLTWPKEFYKPKYSSKPDPLLDLRSTLYWQPGIITDEQGKAQVSFYTKGKKAAYTIIMQGADVNGCTGYRKMQLVVKNEIITPSK